MIDFVIPGEVACHALGLVIGLVMGYFQVRDRDSLWCTIVSFVLAVGYWPLYVLMMLIIIGMVLTTFKVCSDEFQNSGLFGS